MLHLMMCVCTRVCAQGQRLLMCTANVIGRAFLVLLIDDAHGAASWSIVCRGLIADTPGSKLTWHGPSCIATQTPRAPWPTYFLHPLRSGLQAGLQAGAQIVPGALGDALDLAGQHSQRDGFAHRIAIRSSNGLGRAPGHLRMESAYLPKA